VVALEAGAILGALAGSRVFKGTGENFPVTLAVPAICVTLVFFAILFGVRESTPIPGRKLDGGGFVLLTLALLFLLLNAVGVASKGAPVVTDGEAAG